MQTAEGQSDSENLNEMILGAQRTGNTTSNNLLQDIERIPVPVGASLSGSPAKF